MNSTAERNNKIREILDSLFNRAIDDTVHIDESPFSSSMDELFSTSAWGFREILLVVIVGMKLNKTFRASTGLYDCNPRAIYEGPIKEFLIEKNIPHRKSGPLNIAKAVIGLDLTWAAKRRPAKVAEEVVNLVNYLEGASTDSDNERIDTVGISLIRRLMAHTRNLQNLSVNIEFSADPDFLYYLCHELITKAPDAGNTPQRIAAYLLKNHHYAMNTGIKVTGENDRASVTSTTSKKPGDINEESTDGVIYKVYEVTVKHFDLARIRDSFDCVSIYNGENNAEIHEIIVICRKEDCPMDMHPSGMHGYLGYYEYQDVIYRYWDIFEWIANILQMMVPEGRIGFYQELNSYIDDINTASSVKTVWRELHVS